MAWRPSASLETLQRRAVLLQRLRAFFAARGVLEVETPLLSHTTTTDPHIQSMTTCFTGAGAAAGQPLYLQTSPEFAMKRLLAAGSGAIFQICKAFRDGESGHLHNPEFSLLEWYRPGFDADALMDEVAALLCELLGGDALCERLSYGEAFARYADCDPHEATLAELQQCFRRHCAAELSGIGKDDRDSWLELILVHVIEPHLGVAQPTFIYDYPASQAALARIRPGHIPLAERFELYINGIEIANGYHEVTAAEEQRRRFAADRTQRRSRQLADVPEDQRLLDAMVAGMPACSGVALGLDRLLMVLTQATSIDQVLAFPVARA